MQTPLTAAARGSAKQPRKRDGSPLFGTRQETKAEIERATAF